ncbi:MAG: NAD-dependent succinate-semialdehyde dehydrogenase, partial [Hyphomicrobiales bacterium]|nr:NAD-dependent succinate-semialdehyde dehydrogenase [Hyphomicrobiales bacterium]
MYPDLALFIAGEWKKTGASGRSEEVVDPATGKAIATLPHAGKADLDNAVAAAEHGFRVWSRMSAYDRALVMRRAAHLFRERHDSIARTLVREQGKVFAEARIETLMGADIIDWYAEEG